MRRVMQGAQPDSGPEPQILRQSLLNERLRLRGTVIRVIRRRREHHPCGMTGLAQSQKAGKSHPLATELAPELPNPDGILRLNVQKP